MKVNSVIPSLVIFCDYPFNLHPPAFLPLFAKCLRSSSNVALCAGMLEDEYGRGFPSLSMSCAHLSDSHSANAPFLAMGFPSPNPDRLQSSTKYWNLSVSSLSAAAAMNSSSLSPQSANSGPPLPHRLPTYSASSSEPVKYVPVARGASPLDTFVMVHFIAGHTISSGIYPISSSLRLMRLLFRRTKHAILKFPPFSLRSMRSILLPFAAPPVRKACPATLRPLSSPPPFSRSPPKSRCRPISCRAGGRQIGRASCRERV